MVYALFVSGCYVLAVGCFGAALLRLILGRWAPDQQVSLSAWVGSVFLLGQGVLAQVWLLLALWGWLTPGVVCGVLFLVTLLGLRVAAFPILTIRGTLAEGWRELLSEPRIWQGLALCCLAAVLVSGLESLCLTIPSGGDAAASYMAVSKLTAGIHRLIPLPGFEFIVQLGLLGEMQVAALMSLGLTDAAKFLCWPVGLAGSLMLLALGELAGLRQRGQWMLLAMFWTSSTVTIHVWDGKVDLFGGSLGLAAYYWAIRTGGRPGLAGLCLTGIFSTLAVLAKLTLLVALVPGIVVLVIWRCLSQLSGSAARRSVQAALSLLVCGLAGLAVVWPNVLKNTILFGEPLAPCHFFVSPHRSEMDGSVLSLAETRYILSIYPLALVFGRFSNMGWSLSPLFLAFFPLGFFLPRAGSLFRSTLFQLMVAALTGLIAWNLFRPSNFAPRYLLPTLLVLGLLPAAAAEFVSRTERRPYLLTGMILLCLFATTLSQLHCCFVVPRLRYAIKNELRPHPAGTYPWAANSGPFILPPMLSISTPRPAIEFCWECGIATGSERICSSRLVPRSLRITFPPAKPARPSNAGARPTGTDTATCS